MNLPKSDAHAPGSWKLLLIHDQGRQEYSATITCPDCGQVGALVDHHIDAQGNVEPSVVCATPGCPFHQTLHLDGWEEGCVV